MAELKHYHVVVNGKVVASNSGAYLIQAGGTRPNYFWVPRKIVSHVDAELGIFHVYEPIWKDIVKKAPPEQRETYSLYV